MQQIIDDDPILKKLDAELADINQSYVPRLRQMKKEDPRLFKKMQDMGIIGKDFK
jgi:phage host-nuclease inhibitor protein Gam